MIEGKDKAAPSQVRQHSCRMGCEQAAKGQGLRWQRTAPSLQTHDRQPSEGWWKCWPCACVRCSNTQSDGGAGKKKGIGRKIQMEKMSKMMEHFNLSSRYRDILDSSLQAPSLGLSRTAEDTSSSNTGHSHSAKKTTHTEMTQVINTPKVGRKHLYYAAARPA